MTLHTNVRATAEIYQREGGVITIQPTDVMYSTSRYHEAALIEVTGISESPLEDVRGVSLGEIEGEIDSDSDADTPQDPLVPNSTANLFINNVLIGGGEIQDISTDEEGLVSFTAVDSLRNIIQNNFTRSFAEGVPIQTAIRTVIEDAGIIPYPGSELGGGETADPNSDRLPGESAYHLQVTDAIDQSLEERPQAGMAPFITDREFTGVSSLEALDTLVADANWYFHCDFNNVIRIVPQPDWDTYELEYILETTAGLQRPPYQTVVVVGGRQRDPRERRGPVPNNTMSRDPVRAEVGDGPPVYTYTDKSITYQSNAENVAQGILEEFQRQQGQGEVTIVGNPNIRPFDTIVMPEEMGGEEYLVSSVEHTVNGTDGFQTTIGVGGVTDTGV